MIKFSIRFLLCYFFICGQVVATLAQSASLLPNGKQTFLDNDGNPLTSGTVDFYIPSTSTRKNTWQNSGKTVLNTNPVILDAAGRAIIYGDGTYRQVVKDSNGNLIWDQLTSSTGSGGGGSATGDGDLVGTIKPWAGLAAPNQYVFAYGQELSRSTYSALLTAITLTQSFNCISGSPTLTGMSDTTQISIGAVVEATCVPSGSTVSSRTSTTITLNHNATLSTTVNGMFFLYGNGNGSTTFNVPDLRGYTIAGRSNMGGTASTNLTQAYYGTLPDSLNAKGGSQGHTMTGSQLPPYTPAGTISTVSGDIGSITPAGDISQITPAGTVTAPTITFSSSGNNGYTPTGTLNSPTITNVFSSSGTNSYTPSGTNATSSVSATTTTTVDTFPTGAGGGGISFYSPSAGVLSPLSSSGTAVAQVFTGNAITLTSTLSSLTFTGSSITASNSIPTFSGTPTTPTFTGTPVTPIFTGNAPIFTGTPTIGTSAPFSIIQPTVTLNYIIKITPDTVTNQTTGVTSIQSMTGDIACGSGLLCTGNTISVNAIATGVNQLTNYPDGATYTGNIVIKGGLKVSVNTLTEFDTPVFTPEDFGAVCGGGDATSAFVALGAAIQNAGTGRVEFARNCIYNVYPNPVGANNLVNVSNVNNLKINCNGSYIETTSDFSGPSNTATINAFLIANSTNITINDCRFDQPNHRDQSDGLGWIGVYLNGNNTNITVNNLLLSAGGAGVSCTRGVNVNKSYNLTINNLFVQNVRYGFVNQKGCDNGTANMTTNNIGRSTILSNVNNWYMLINSAASNALNDIEIAGTYDSNDVLVPSPNITSNIRIDYYNYDNSFGPGPVSYAEIIYGTSGGSTEGPSIISGIHLNLNVERQASAQGALLIVNNVTSTPQGRILENLEVTGAYRVPYISSQDLFRLMTDKDWTGDNVRNLRIHDFTCASSNRATLNVDGRAITGPFILENIWGNSNCDFASTNMPSKYLSYNQVWLPTLIAPYANPKILGPFTRDLNATTSGTDAKTGLGFKPTSCIAGGAVAPSTTQYVTAFGNSDASGDSFSMSGNGGLSAFSNFIFATDPAGANAQSATISSYDDDGLTLSWVKVGAPAGTLTYFLRCSK